MNERIKDFLDEATEIHDDRNTGVSYPVVDYKIFAELIVRECAKVANDNFNTGFCPVGEFITEHFGVE